MMRNCNKLWREEDGVLSFEWTLLVTLFTLGIVAGLSAARDAIIDELGDAAQAMLALDHSMTIDFPLSVIVHDDSDISGASECSNRPWVTNALAPSATATTSITTPARRR